MSLYLSSKIHQLFPLDPYYCQSKEEQLVMANVGVWQEILRMSVNILRNNGFELIFERFLFMTTDVRWSRCKSHSESHYHYDLRDDLRICVAHISSSVIPFRCTNGLIFSCFRSMTFISAPISKQRFCVYTVALCFQSTK
jgi:hypothetical protein